MLSRYVERADDAPGLLDLHQIGPGPVLCVDRVEREDIPRVLVRLVPAETEAELSDVFKVEVRRFFQPDMGVFGTLDLLRIIEAEEVDPILPEEHEGLVFVVLDPVVSPPTPAECGCSPRGGCSLARTAISGRRACGPGGCFVSRNCFRRICATLVDLLDPDPP